MAMFHLFQINGDHVDKLENHDNAPVLDAIASTCRNPSNAYMLEYTGVKYLGHRGEPFPRIDDMQWVDHEIGELVAKMDREPMAEAWLRDLMMGKRGPTPEELVWLVRGYLRFYKLQNMPMKEAQAMFWNYASRKDRAKAIDAVVLG